MEDLLLPGSETISKAVITSSMNWLEADSTLLGVGVTGEDVTMGVFTAGTTQAIHYYMRLADMADT